MTQIINICPMCGEYEGSINLDRSHWHQFEKRHDYMCYFCKEKEKIRALKRKSDKKEASHVAV